MIVPMKHLLLLCVASETDRTLETLRGLGAVHLVRSCTLDGSAPLPGPQNPSAESKERLEHAERAVRIALKAADSVGVEADGSGAAVSPESVVEEILALDARREELKGEVSTLQAAIRRYEPFGDFDPALAERLAEAGVRLVLRDDGSFEFMYDPDDPDRPAAERPGTHLLPLPAERLSITRRRLDDAEAEIASLTRRIAAADVDGIMREFPALRDAVAFAEAKEGMSAVGQIGVVSGWIATDAEAELKAAARANGWGVSLRDPDPEETPPTLIRPPKLFRPIKVLFDGLGIAPAYSESDVSVPFMCYFSLFFAMLVGDGGYGAIILALTLWGWRRCRAAKRPVPLVRSWLTLLTVFSIATVAWGAISNTWFGAGLPFAAEWPTVKWLGDPTYGNMMLLCFTIGASHLVLARLWNGICRINSAECLPEFGWAGILVFMYFVVNAIVGISDGVPTWSYWLFGVSIALVVSKTRGVALGMLPLNVMSAMGDIISYVRLFAVGYASLQVAKNFNGMALELDLPMWAKVVPMVAILLLGHGINFVLAGLSILVHAVRLNTLEFSNHKGLTWSGYAFSPFRKH